MTNSHLILRSVFKLIQNESEQFDLKFIILSKMLILIRHLISVLRLNQISIFEIH